MRPLPKKTKAKPEEVPIELPEVYYVIGADLSLKRPGFCKIKVEAGELTDLKLMSVDNKTKTKPHGELLNEIGTAFLEFIPDPEKDQTPCFYVREHSIIKTGNMYERSLDEVVGIMNWFSFKFKFDWHEIYPATIKKLITGNGKATKDEVAAALPQYVGDISYANDDESDAAGVAISFLIQNKVLNTERRNENGNKTNTDL